MLRRLLSASFLLPVILLLLWLDFYLGNEASLAMPGLMLAAIAILLGAIMALEIRSLWSTTQPNSQSCLKGEVIVEENGFPSARPGADLPGADLRAADFPPVFSLVLGTVMMLIVACVLPVCLPVLTPLLADGISKEAILRAESPADYFGHIFFYGNPIQFSFYGLIVAVTWTFATEMYRFKAEENRSGVIANRLGHSVLVYIYVLMLFGFLIPHRWLLDDNRIGLVALIGLIATVKLSDSFAYFAGKLFGTVKLAPELSPKKTVQGAFGALVGGLIAAFIVFYSVAPIVFGIAPFLTWGWVVVYAVLISCAAMFGDLAESLLKRDAACKDSGSILPGMGGILDVLDSLVFAAPVSYLLWQWQALGGAG